MLCHTRDKWNRSVRTFARHQMLPTDKACLQEHLHEVKVQTQQHNTWKHNLSWTLLETHMGQGMQCRSWDIDLFWHLFDHKTILVGYAEKFLDVSLDVAGQVSPAVAFEWHSIRPNEKLLEIPSDVISAHGTPHDQFGVVHEGHWLIAREWKFLLEKDEERVGGFPVHVDFLQELEFRFKAIARTDIL